MMDVNTPAPVLRNLGAREVVDSVRGGCTSGKGQTRAKETSAWFLEASGRGQCLYGSWCSYTARVLASASFSVSM